jgi:hypothetical protein
MKEKERQCWRSFPFFQEAQKRSAKGLLSLNHIGGPAIAVIFDEPGQMLRKEWPADSWKDSCGNSGHQLAFSVLFPVPAEWWPHLTTGIDYERIANEFLLVCWHLLFIWSWWPSQQTYEKKILLVELVIFSFSSSLNSSSTDIHTHFLSFLKRKRKKRVIRGRFKEEKKKKIINVNDHAITCGRNH